MRWVDQAITRPHRCAVFPQVGNGSGHMFIDTGNELDLEHVYISDVAAEEIAKAAGYVPPLAVRQLEAERDDLQQRLALAEAELAEADKFQSHVDGLRRHGFTIGRAPGRPKKQQKEKVL